jgi:hypothetical protein
LAWQGKEIGSRGKSRAALAAKLRKHGLLSQPSHFFALADLRKSIGRRPIAYINGRQPATTHTRPGFLGCGGETAIRTSQPRAFRKRNNLSVEKPSSLPFSSAETLGWLIPEIRKHVPAAVVDQGCFVGHQSRSPC